MWASTGQNPKVHAPCNMYSKRWGHYLLLCLIIGLLPACQTRIDNQLAGEEDKINVQGFDLYLRKKNLHPAKALHIYIEGDGRPWIGNRIMIDPGPSNLMALFLMQEDTSPSIYLGRPCYFQSKIGLPEKCNAALWTRARYSQQIVDLMVSALNSQKNLDQYAEWVLIGHSGGGTLAYLMAHELPKVKTVVAISSNLDVDAWIKHHQYSPLDWSLDPSQLEPEQSLQVFYLTGGKDTNVPYELNKNFLEKINAKIIFRPDYNHTCCWKKEWPDILQTFSND